MKEDKTKTMKEKLIKEYLSKPIQIGDIINYGRNYIGKVIKVNKDHVEVLPYGFKDNHVLAHHEYTKGTYELGANPFVKKPWNSELKTIAFGLESILILLGYERRNLPNNLEYVNWNPSINGVVYQRDLCWSKDQKIALIDSIYNNINIGSIVVKRNNYTKESKKVNGYLNDIVDGKQRLNAIFGFINNDYQDSYGNYFKDLSDMSQNKFRGFSSLSYSEVGENATDEDIKAIFLGINFKGVQMSRSHIEFVKNIKL